MKIKRILSLTLVCSMLFGVPVMANEGDAVSSYDTEAASLEYLESIEFPECKAIKLSAEEVSELMTKERKQTRITVPDDYEPNDTVSTAFPYNKVETVNRQLTSRNDLFGLGMRQACLHSEDDEDWFSIKLTAGEKYFVDLRNIGKSNWYIELYYFGTNGNEYKYTTNPEERPIFEKRPEKYFYFTAKDTGTYYIKISSGNDWANVMNYFFYVGPTIQYFNIVDMPTYGSVQIYGGGYSTYTFDLRKEIVPANTSIVNLTMTDSFPRGTECTEVARSMSAGGKTYYSTNGSGSGIVNGISGVSLGQLWTIGGKCRNGKHFTYWSCELNGRFSCIMEPYPGLELPS